jgi:hypothetical protein
MRYAKRSSCRPTPDWRYVRPEAAPAEHNAGKSSFSDDQKAETFERYLKSGSWHACANKKLWQDSRLMRTKLGTVMLPIIRFQIYLV